uniref:NADH-ubiquinone oxidoreductase chain 6 n=1 Tax=Protobothrops flavoviridis TaxID=88087 RepID=A0A160PU84_PROFL|nr:NADH dehydrogenase subunit 6 [Protobothrops flavoviridis]BAU97756.1 NADH dehydrogenase subunit 6 [Protobothrops flavoviridis]BAU97769.1 NADH dehydrogenase subunit 6 [Protobothrops flavoviridis]BAU97782.1 NADH dehydrogenase subunit 6 [Protobothrops flavoviridis]BAU97847.1 NADH dehydrogenase subunit 6 [Protobothrops flavoviridis]
MFLVEYLFYFILTLVFFGVVVLSFSVVPYHGVVSLMGISFFCCVAMVVMGRTYAALVMYVVYLGGLVVVFGYCVSVEKGGEVVVGINGFWFLVVFFGVGVVVCVLMLVLGGGVQGLLVYSGWEDWVCLEVNGYGVFYCGGGVGLVVCAWGLVVTLFSVLVILGWTRLGGLRPF